MTNDYFTKEELEEMDALEKDEAVWLAKQEQYDKYRERQRLYKLRFLKKRGDELMKDKDSGGMR